jgi:hypothetical protein
MKNLLKNILTISIYTIMFLIITHPLTEHLNFDILEKISVSLIFGFFTGILNEILRAIYNLKK